MAHAFGSSDLTPVLRIMVLALPFVVGQMVLIGATRGTGGMRSFVIVDQVLDGVFRLGAITDRAAARHRSLRRRVGVHGRRRADHDGGRDRRPAGSCASRSPAPRPGRWSCCASRGTSGARALAGVGLLWADTLLLGLWRPPADVAVYSIVTRTVLFGMMFILPIGIAFQPVIARLYAIGDRGALASMYRFATKWSTLAGCPPLLFLAIFATPVIALLYPNSYTRGAWPMAILALGADRERRHRPLRPHGDHGGPLRPGARQQRRPR